MGIILSKICVLVTTAFVLTLVPGFRRSERSLLSLRDRGTALLVFMILGLVEQTVVGQTGWFNHRIVVVCAAGLLAGPGVGLATIVPAKIPRAAGRIRHFLRASFDQHEQALVPLAEELEVVRAYLDIESLRYGDRLKLEEAIDPSLLEALIPPFSLQPLVENAVQHGLRSSPKAGCLHLRVRRRIGDWLDMSVRDDGPGVAATEVERVFFALGSAVHALSLLRRRLQGLFGRSFWLEVCSDVGQGTMVTLRIPLQTQLDVRTQSFPTGTS